MRKTKIICTIGPASEKPEVLRELMKAGMNCARLNFSHGDHEEHKKRIETIKKIREELKIPLPILLDTKGPEIRVRDFKEGFIFLEEGQEFVFKPDDGSLGDQNEVCVTYPNLAKDVKVGNSILIDDGKIVLEVEKISGENVHCRVQNSGKVSNHKSINVPYVNINIPFLSKQDRLDIAFGVNQGIDYIAASFVRTKEDIVGLREYLRSIHAEDVKIISKIENMQGIQNIDDIIDVSDGIMIARGDMGVEVHFSKLPPIQKDIINKCYLKGKLVVTATQMLDSMESNPRPTRAEVSDVANAIYDGTTCIMLSGETAAGKYPVESVKAMAAIALEAEEAIDYAQKYLENDLSLGSEVGQAIGNSAVISATQLNASAIIAITKKGTTARIVSSYRPTTPIIACALDEQTCRQLYLYWNVLPIMAERKATTDDLFSHGLERAMTTGLLKKGDKVAIVGASVAGDAAIDVLKLQIV